MVKNNLITKGELRKINQFIKKISPKRELFNKTEEHIKKSYDLLNKKSLNILDKKS